jgi:hypothetical protein
MPTQLRVKPTTSITSNISTNPTAYISTINTTVNATTANTKPSMYTPTTTAVNVTTDTTCRNANACTTESTYATTIVPIAYTTKDKGDEKRCTEGWNTEGKWMGGGQRDKSEGTRTKASTTAQNDDDKWSYRPGHIPQTTDSHGDSIPISVAHVSVVPVEIDTFANRAPVTYPPFTQVTKTHGAVSAGSAVMPTLTKITQYIHQSIRYTFPRTISYTRIPRHHLHLPQFVFSKKSTIHMELG